MITLRFHRSPHLPHGWEMWAIWDVDGGVMAGRN